MNLGKAARIAAGLIVAWFVIQWLMSNPQQAANTVNSGAQQASHATSSITTFFSGLGQNAWIFLVIIIVAIVLARKR